LCRTAVEYRIVIQRRALLTERFGVDSAVDRPPPHHTAPRHATLSLAAAAATTTAVPLKKKQSDQETKHASSSPDSSPRSQPQQQQTVKIHKQQHAPGRALAPTTPFVIVAARTTVVWRRHRRSDNACFS
jgi:hypothetical protein